MTYWLSEPIENLLQDPPPWLCLDDEGPEPSNLPTIIVGSGYGAAMAALALAETRPPSNRSKIVVLERGNEFVPDDLPKTVGDVFGHINVTNGTKLDSGELPRSATENLDKGLWDIRVGTGIVSIVGMGVGGTSLINANVAIDPTRETFASWKGQDADAWYQLISPYLSKIRMLLGATPSIFPERFAKYRALKKVAEALDIYDTEGASITINRGTPTPHSADHKPCNDCGNCVIGCHSGAKGSLNMNAWPLARQLGVLIYSGVLVRYVTRIEGGWILHCSPARGMTTTFQLRASQVILAAGTLGSTEILLRSRQHGLRLSSSLGNQFSTNGDALVFGAGQKEAVHAMAPVPQDPLQSVHAAPGPTIVGKVSIPLKNIDGTLGNVTHITLEDGAIPQPLVAFCKELIATQLCVKNVIGDGETAWHSANPSVDPLASPDALGRHHQVLLAMGIDDATHGSLNLSLELDRVLPTWSFSDNDYFARLDHTLRQAEFYGGFDGGRYLPNPLWKPLPDGFDTILGGADKFPQHVITVQI